MDEENTNELLHTESEASLLPEVRNLSLANYYDDIGSRKHGKHKIMTRFARCNLCDKEVARPDSSTSGMRNHLR